VNNLKNRKYSEAILGFTSYFQYLLTHPGSFLTRYQDQAHLLLGRALYATARFKESADEFQKVKKTSNEQIEALSNLAWAYLLQEKYDDAIGVALQLRSGGLRNTFAPEPIMVSAMALNELCLYPESIRMVQAFVKDYLSSFNWLKKNSNRPDGYDLTLKAIKSVQVAPSKLATEWIRRPEFLTRQTEINEMISHPKLIAETEGRAYTEQVRLTKDWVTRAATFIQEVKVANLKLRTNQTLAPEFADRYATLKRDHRKLSQFYRASKVWKALARSYEKRLPAMRAELVKRVNVDFNKKNQRLMAVLRNVRDNSDLIEVEIYNGASQDIVWKNAHPDFEAKKDDLVDEKSGPDQTETWSGGHFLASDIENSEVWEDELGALKADVHSQCNAKEKFLKLSLMKREK
jgi:tetratricopeptide (TPR) repeat protein